MIKSILLAIALTLLFAVSAYGQDAPPDHTTDEMVAARAKLIDRYVAKNGYAWGVSICGTDDAWSGRSISYLTIYVYEDAAGVFNTDLAQFGTRLGVSRIFTVDGIPIFVERIVRPKGKSHEPKAERNDRQRRNSNRSSDAALFVRPTPA